MILVARNDVAHGKLARQFAERTIEKEYYALVAGSPLLDRDIIDCPIGFHPHQREKMAIRRDDLDSRPAQTFYEVLERFAGFAALRLVPKTGRTHQIRVHLHHIACPVLCDKQYAGRAAITRGENTAPCPRKAWAWRPSRIGRWINVAIRFAKPGNFRGSERRQTRKLFFRQSQLTPARPEGGLG